MDDMNTQAPQEDGAEMPKTEGEETNTDMPMTDGDEAPAAPEMPAEHNEVA
jgi:hypothetical protein